jgi:hypothetical protein
MYPVLSFLLDTALRISQEPFAIVLALTDTASSKQGLNSLLNTLNLSVGTWMPFV